MGDFQAARDEREAVAVVVGTITRGAGGGGGGTGSSFKPFSELIKRLGPRDRWPPGAGCRVPADRRPRMRTDARLIRALLTAPAPPLLRRVARQPRLGALLLVGGARLPGGAGQWSAPPRPGRGPGSGRGSMRLPSDLSRRKAGARRGGEGGAARPFLEKSLLTRFLSRGRTASCSRGCGGAGWRGALRRAPVPSTREAASASSAKPPPRAQGSKVTGIDRVDVGGPGTQQVWPGALDSPGPPEKARTCTRCSLDPTVRRDGAWNRHVRLKLKGLGALGWTQPSRGGRPEGQGPNSSLQTSEGTLVVLNGVCVL